MIQANELRIGNIVSYNGWLYKIGALSKEYPFLNTDEFGVGVITYQNIDGVELTPEILEKCGFVDNRSNIYGNQESISLDFDGDHYNIFLKQLNIDGTLENILMDKEIKYIHQLQNLYFQLTGQELNIQP